jgi:hypothetical protein
LDASLIFGALLGAGMIGFLLLIRLKDLPAPIPISPFQHLEERKAAIYENLRDLQFEYRVDKLSDADYQATKLELQKELAVVMAETDKIKSGLTAAPPPAPKKKECQNCGAKYEKAPKFCPECGKPI